MQTLSLPELWPHQTAAIGSVELAMASGLASGLVVLPTGTGKTGMVLSLGRRLGLPMLFLVNRDELLGQTARAAGRFWPEAHVGLIEAGSRDWDSPTLEQPRRPDLAVGMVSTLVNRLELIDPERFGIVVADEAHYSVAPTWRRVLEWFKPGFLLGVTATPQRLDGKGLSCLYGREPLYSYSLHQAIKDGRLVPIESRAVRTSTDLDGVGTTAGEDGEPELRQGALAAAVNNHERNELIVDAYLKHGKGRRAIAFCVDRDHVRALAREFQARKVRAEAVLGGDVKGRRSLIETFARGELDVLVNCEVLTTGFDDPGVSCLLMARPTQSRSLYLQMVGRGLRLAPGKSNCLVVDFTDNCREHKLASVLDLLGKRKPLQTGAASERPPLTPEMPAPLQGSLGFPATVAWQLETVCPWPSLPTLDGYVPQQAWHNDPASEGQLRCLAGFGLALQEEVSKGEASYLIDRALEFEAVYPVPATARQRRLLEEHGLWTEGMGKRQAGILIGRIKAKEKQ